jgi:hypothetical protein
MADLYNVPKGSSYKAGAGVQLAPAPKFPERPGTQFESKMAPAQSGQVGPLRFEEGIATDTDVPNDFTVGVMQGYKTAAGRPNHNENVYEKYPEETMRERAHVGSAAWVEAPTYLGEFAHGTNTVLAERKFEMEDRGTGLGRRFERRNAAMVMD